MGMQAKTTKMTRLVNLESSTSCLKFISFTPQAHYNTRRERSKEKTVLFYLSFDRTNAGCHRMPMVSGVIHLF